MLVLLSLWESLLLSDKFVDLSLIRSEKRDAAYGGLPSFISFTPGERSWEIMPTGGN